jgi:uncharacterized membrane protein YfcA
VTATAQVGARPSLVSIAIGAIVNFFDTLGVGSFATSTAIFRRWKLVDDRDIPGTLNVGHALPTLVQAYIFTQLVPVDRVTLWGMILSAGVGAWAGAGIVTRLPRHRVQLGMGIALTAAGILMALTVAKLMPGGGEAYALTGAALAIGIGGNFVLGALMTLGIGLYAPCMILIYLLGMHPTAAFPIMMGSCALLMPVASVRFIKTGRYDRVMSIGLAVGGIPAVLAAAYLVKSMPLDVVRVLVVVVVLYTAVGLIRAALRPQPQES